MMTEVKGKVALSIVTIRKSTIELKELQFQQPFNAHRAPHALLYTTCTIVHHMHYCTSCTICAQYTILIQQ